METTNQISKGRLWTSYILQGILSLMLLSGGIMNLLMTETAIKGAMDMGYPQVSVHYLGMILTISSLLYIFPKTAILGAILITGWLGGAVASHIIHGDTLGTTIFPVIFGILIWTSLILRNKALLRVFPLAK